MSAEALQNLERYIELLAQTGTQLRDIADEAHAASEQLAASSGQLEQQGGQAAAAATSVLQATDAALAPATAGIDALTAVAEPGVPDDVEEWFTQIDTTERGALEQTAAEIDAGYDELTTQGLDPLRTAADETENAAKAMEAQVESSLEAAFKSVTLSIDAVQTQSESLLPEMATHAQRYAELSGRTGEALEGFVGQVNDGVLVPLGLDAASMAAAQVSEGLENTMNQFVSDMRSNPIGAVGGLAASMSNAGSMLGNAGAVLGEAATVFGSGGAVINTDGAGVIVNNGGNLISDNGSGLLSDQGSGLISNAQGSLVTDNGAGVLGNAAGNLISESGSTASLISNEAGGLISNAVGGLIGNDSAGILSNANGGLVSDNGLGAIGENGAGIVGNAAGNIISRDGAGLIGTDGGS